MANGASDWALVVGIAKYPNYGPNPGDPNDLRGPINDAVAVSDFLQNIYGVQNVTLLTSAQNNGANWKEEPRPIKHDIEAWIKNILVQSHKNVDAGKGPQVGRRLYIYLSGHGLAPEKSKRALVTADALSTTFIDHYLATTAQEYLCNTRCFSEYVLLMDCCTQARVTLVPALLPFEIKQPLNPQPPQVVACAAKFPELAVELALGSQGEFHGVFTYELLRGLRGAAANPSTGGIRTKDLAGYLYRAMPIHIDKLPDPKGISREPDFLEDDDMEFMAPQPAAATTKLRRITIVANGSPPPADGTPVNITDHAGEPIAIVPVAAGKLAQALPPGMYKLEWAGGKRIIEFTDEEAIDA